MVKIVSVSLPMFAELTTPLGLLVFNCQPTNFSTPHSSKRHMLLKMLSYVSFSKNIRTSPKKLTYDNDDCDFILSCKNQPYVTAVVSVATYVCFLPSLQIFVVRAISLKRSLVSLFILDAYSGWHTLINELAPKTYLRMWLGTSSGKTIDISTSPLTMLFSFQAV